MNYIETLKNDLAVLPNGNTFNLKVKLIERIIASLEKKQLPKYHFPKLQLSESEITSFMQKNMFLSAPEFEKMSTDLEKFDHDLGELRTYLQQEFGYWATITQDFVEQITIDFPDQSFLELMAGNGFLSKGLRDLGVKTYCTDNLSWSKHDQTGNKLLTEVESLDAISALAKYGNKVDNVIVAWSPDREEIDVQILQEMRKLDANFLLIGEFDGATDSQEFWNQAKLVTDSRIKQINRVYSRYDLVHDQLYLVK